MCVYQIRSSQQTLQYTFRNIRIVRLLDFQNNIILTNAVYILFKEELHYNNGKVIKLTANSYIRNVCLYNRINYSALSTDTKQILLTYDYKFINISFDISHSREYSFTANNSNNNNLINTNIKLMVRTNEEFTELIMVVAIVKILSSRGVRLGLDLKII